MRAVQNPSRLQTKAEQERSALAEVFIAKARTRMLTAGGFGVDHLSDQARRTLAWLADTDSPTVDGVVDLLSAAHSAGRLAAASGQTASTRRRARRTAPAPGPATTGHAGEEAGR